MKKMLPSILLLLSLLSRSANAQQLVAEVGAQLFNTTITSINTVAQTAHWVLEQTPLDGMSLGEEWFADLAQLQALAQEAQALAFDASATRALVDSLFRVETAPSTSTALAQRLWTIRRVVSESYGYAMRTQALILTVQRTIQHMRGIYHTASHLIGNLGGSQNLGQADVKVQQVVSEQELIVAAWQRAQSLERITEPMILESLERINHATMADHPR